MEKFNFEVSCDNCHNKFKYGGGDIVIECGSEGVRCPKCGNWIYHSNDNKTNHMELWIARDKDNSLGLYSGLEPERGKTYFRPNPYGESDFYDIDRDLFPEVTWENSPRKVKIELL